MHKPEISWFSALCDDDYEYLGVPDPRLQSSLPHCRDIVMRAEKGGFDNILLPSGYALGMDSIAFAGAVAPLLKQMQLLVAVRCGEMWPPQLARQLATLDHMLGGRLTINIISSDLPGETMESAPRYARTLEVMQILRTLLAGHPLSHKGEFYNLEIDPPRQVAAHDRSPPFYFGGLSDHARDVAARAADVFLMWPDRMENIRLILDDMRKRATSHGRLLRFGYRVHVIVRETEAEARAHARKIMSKLDAATGEEIRKKSLDAGSFGVRRQAEMRDEADDEGFVEDNLWTGIGRARSGCGAALVGDPDQIIRKIEAYQALGLDAFIFSGYPHAEEANLFARYVLPKIKHAPLFSRAP
ncbi:MAG: LLM class flavin-dependent oxidoreductase [Rhizobiales bacterium]|nr:LLM class flavin-dependent oxidoreductase [Hyphomicrobiales bacterium]